MMEKANQAAKPILIMNEVISSMTSNYTPSRYEVGDLSQVVLDGADGVTLQKETALGDFPIECIIQVSKIASKAETIFDNDGYYKKVKESQAEDVNDLDV